MKKLFLTLFLVLCFSVSAHAITCDVYYDTGASGADDGTSFPDAYDTMAEAITGASTGETICVSHTSNEAISTTIDLDGKALNIIVVDDADDSLVSDYQSSGNGEISCDTGRIFKGGTPAYVYGLRFTRNGGYGTWKIGDTLSNATENYVFENCYFEAYGNAYKLVLAYGEGSKATYLNCDFDSAIGSYAVGLDCATGSSLEIVGGAYLSSGTTGPAIFNVGSYGCLSYRVVNMDLSNMDSSHDLVSANPTSYGNSTEFILERLKLPSGWSGSLASSVGASDKIKMYGSASAHDGTNNTHHAQYWEEQYTGSIIEDTTVYRSGSFDGTHGYSFKMTGDGTYCSWAVPLRFEMIAVHKDWSNASYDTIEVYFTSDTVLDNSEFWIEVEYPSSSSGWTNGKRATNRIDFGETPTAYSDGQGSWTNGEAYTYKAEVTLSGAEEGFAKVFAVMADDTNPIYVCPKVGFN